MPRPADERRTRSRLDRESRRVASRPRIPRTSTHSIWSFSEDTLIGEGTTRNALVAELRQAIAAREGVRDDDEHRTLYERTAEARHVMEQALARLLPHEQISV